MKKIKVLGDRLLVKRASPRKSKRGILLPESAQEKPQEGIVVARGPGVFDDEGKVKPMTVAVGDAILFGPYSGMTTLVEEEEWLILSEKEVLGVFLSRE